MDDDSEEGFQVERVLRKHGNFYSMFPHLHTQILFALYKIWVIRYFMEQFGCYMQGRVLYIDAPDMRTQIPLLPQNGDVFKKFLTAVTEIGNPSLSIHKYLEVWCFLVLLSHYCHHCSIPLFMISCCDGPFIYLFNQVQVHSEPQGLWKTATKIADLFSTFSFLTFFFTIHNLFLASLRLTCAGHLGSDYFLCPYSTTITVAIKP